MNKSQNFLNISEIDVSNIHLDDIRKFTNGTAPHSRIPIVYRTKERNVPLTIAFSKCTTSVTIFDQQMDKNKSQKQENAKESYRLSCFISDPKDVKKLLEIEERIYSLALEPKNSTNLGFPKGTTSDFAKSLLKTFIYKKGQEKNMPQDTITDDNIKGIYLSPSIVLEDRGFYPKSKFYKSDIVNGEIVKSPYNYLRLCNKIERGGQALRAESFPIIIFSSIFKGAKLSFSFDVRDCTVVQEINTNVIDSDHNPILMDYYKQHGLDYEKISSPKMVESSSSKNEEVHEGNQGDDLLSQLKNVQGSVDLDNLDG